MWPDGVGDRLQVDRHERLTAVSFDDGVCAGSEVGTECGGESGGVEVEVFCGGRVVVQGGDGAAAGEFGEQFELELVLRAALAREHSVGRWSRYSGPFDCLCEGYCGFAWAALGEQF